VTWSAAQAEVSDDVVRVGAHNDISDISQDTIGMGSVEAARTAAEDFNGSGKNIKVEIVYADRQNKADVGSAIARKWLDIDKVDAIGMPAATPSSRPRSSAFRRAEDAGVPAVHQRRARHGAEGSGGPVADGIILLRHG
jgi:ABC-type branched-subunit amino acid transport system substrate-binding protein